jgi:NTP pyrophosphatase (non-canonical NTP hydrolase)
VADGLCPETSLVAGMGVRQQILYAGRDTPTHNDESLALLAARLRTFAHERDWEPFHTPKNLAMALAGEVGELLAELQWLTPEQSAALMTDRRAGARMRAEVGDVMIYLTRFADVLGIDLVQAAHDKLDESASRYPIDTARGSAIKARRDQPGIG